MNNNDSEGLNLLFTFLILLLLIATSLLSANARDQIRLQNDIIIEQNDIIIIQNDNTNAYLSTIVCDIRNNTEIAFWDCVMDRQDAY